MRVRIHPEAEDETRQAARWYEPQQPGLGLEFLAAVDATLERIRRDPERFPRVEGLPNEEPMRRLLVERFPYLVVYEATNDEIQILAIAHSHRRPGYWKHRR